MKSVFPAIYSTLCPLALSEVISDDYILENVTCKLLVRGVGDTYLIQSSEDRFIFRLYRSSHRSLQAITDEVNLLRALNDANVSVSYPIPDRGGKYIQSFHVIEGERHGVLFSYAPGQSVKAMSESQLLSLGQEMGRFHNVSTNINLGQNRWVFNLDTTLFKPLIKLEGVFHENPEDYTWLKNVAKPVEDRLLKTDSSQFASGYCHFDFLPKNFHFDGDHVTFFDFDFMGYGWVINDMMSFWQHLMLDIYTGRMTKETAHHSYETFLDGYRSVRQITTQELKMVPFLSLGFWLFYMGFHTTHDQFYSFSQPAQLKSYTSLLRHLVDHYWNDNENNYCFSI